MSENSPCLFRRRGRLLCSANSEITSDVQKRHVIASSGVKVFPPYSKGFIYIFHLQLIAVAGGGTNAMDVSKNVRARRCTRCPARLQVCCPCCGRLLFIAWASADVRQVLLQQPNARHPSPILEGLLSRYRLARGAFASCCRSR